MKIRDAPKINVHTRGERKAILGELFLILWSEYSLLILEPSLFFLLGIYIDSIEYKKVNGQQWSASSEELRVQYIYGDKNEWKDE